MRCTVGFLFLTHVHVPGDAAIVCNGGIGIVGCVRCGVGCVVGGVGIVGIVGSCVG